MPALVDTVRFASDPGTTVLESNDVVVLLRSDHRAHVTTAREQLLARLKGVLEPTSIRSGFVGAGLPKKLATAAGIPGAEAIPDGAQLFMGFTSTQRSALGPTRIANFESLRGVTDQWPNGYFRHGTVMHLSHLFEDLEHWYDGDFIFRAWAAFRPGINPPDGTQTVPEDASVLQTAAAGDRRLREQRHRRPQRLAAAAVAPCGGDGRQLWQAIRGGDGARSAGRFQLARQPLRLDDRQARETGGGHKPAAGLHFVSFTATASIFERVRRAMDGHYPDGKGTGLPPRDVELGLNSVLRTTHRQNFLVPPRARRSFPLAELA